jgi:hypothetical protein
VPVTCLGRCGWLAGKVDVVANALLGGGAEDRFQQAGESGG